MPQISWGRTQENDGQKGIADHHRPVWGKADPPFGRTGLAAAGREQRLGCRPADPACASFTRASGIWRKGRTHLRTAIFSTFPPRACGIGTFSFDVRSGLLDVVDVEDVSQLVVIDEPSSPQRPGDLRTISQGARGDYVRAARALARTDVDVVLLQRESGIFGGRDGEYVLSFARELSQPLVVTLHTVLSEPTPHQLDVLTALCDEAQRVIVMTETGRRMLIQVGACAEEKIDVIPHGGARSLWLAHVRELDAGRRPRYVTQADGGFEGIESRFLLSSLRSALARQGDRSDAHSAARDRRRNIPMSCTWSRAARILRSRAARARNTG